jgi:hypothetical protein
MVPSQLIASIQVDCACSDRTAETVHASVSHDGTDVILGHDEAELYMDPAAAVALGHALVFIGRSLEPAL